MSTTYSFAKSIALTDYMKPFKTNSELQTWAWDRLVTKKKTNRATEQIFSWAGLPPARETNELQDVFFSDLHELAATTFTVNKYTLGTLFSHEFLQDNQHMPDLMKEAGASMGDSHGYIRDFSVAQTYNRAFNSSYTMYDGVELCGTHTLNDGTSLVNELTAASIAYDSFWLMVDYFETTMYNQSGLYLRDDPKYIIYHPSKEKQVCAVLDSALEPDTADNNINALNSSKGTRNFNFVRVPCRFLSTSTNWFIAGSKFPQDYLFLDRESLKTKMWDDHERMGTKINSWQRFAHGPKEFIRICGNQGA
jgi:hypothetical protein